MIRCVGMMILACTIVSAADIGDTTHAGTASSDTIETRSLFVKSMLCGIVAPVIGPVMVGVVAANKMEDAPGDSLAANIAEISDYRDSARQAVAREVAAGGAAALGIDVCVAVIVIVAYGIASNFPPQTMLPNSW